LLTKRISKKIDDAIIDKLLPVIVDGGDDKIKMMEYIQKKWSCEKLFWAL
jgi:hypothetical protein